MLRAADALAEGRGLDRDEPLALGFVLMVAPAQALGGDAAPDVLAAALAALAFVLATLLARRIVPEPWASTGALLVGLSAPVLAHAAAVRSDPVAGAVLAGAALCALRVRERPTAAAALGGAALLALLPWLGTKYLAPGLPVAVALVAWTHRSGRGTLALIAAEAMVGSLVFFGALNEELYGGLTPYAALPPGASPTGADSALEHLERIPRLAGLWLDRDAGLLRWAPVLALGLYAAWLLWRSRRRHVARAVPARAEAEQAAALVLAACGAQLLVAAFAAPALLGPWFPGRELVAALPCAAALAAWGLRHAPRAGAALGAITLLTSGWLLVELWTGGAPGWSEFGAR